MRISDWSSDVCSSDLAVGAVHAGLEHELALHHQFRVVVDARVLQRLAVTRVAEHGAGERLHAAQLRQPREIGRESRRARVGQSRLISVVAVYLKTNTHKTQPNH